MTTTTLDAGRRGHRASARRLAVLLALCLAGCSGGVDSGGTGSEPASYASGPITGFGSVIVGGVHYDDRSASVTDADGGVHSRDDLKLGMMTEILGGVVLTDTDGASAGTAQSIVYGSAVVGPVASIDLAAGTLVVLGQVITVTSSTVFDDATLGGGLASLAVGDLVEVYALAGTAPHGQLATRIERRNTVPAYVLRAVVGRLDPVARRFDLGGLSVSYAALGGTGEVPVEGQFLRVQLQPAPVAGVWQAARLLSGGRQSGRHEDVRVEGLVTAYTSSVRFSVDGAPVDASQAVFPDGTAGLTAGARVSVDGTAQGGSLMATRVRVKSNAAVEAEGFQLDGLITHLDTVAQTFTVRGVVTGYAGAVDFRGGTAADLAVGRRVEVKGVLSGGTHLQAERIRIRP